MVKTAVKTMSTDQLKAIRRREYYARRVKADFAPSNGPEHTHEEETTEGDDSLDSPWAGKRRQEEVYRKQKAVAEKLRLKKLEKMPEWNKHLNQKESKAKYIKMSDRSVH